MYGVVPKLWVMTPWGAAETIWGGRRNLTKILLLYTVRRIALIGSCNQWSSRSKEPSVKKVWEPWMHGIECFQDRFSYILISPCIPSSSLLKQHISIITSNTLHTCIWWWRLLPLLICYSLRYCNIVCLFLQWIWLLRSFFSSSWIPGCYYSKRPAPNPLGFQPLGMSASGTTCSAFLIKVEELTASHERHSMK